MGSTPSKISASRGAAVLGVSKYKSPLHAWLEIMEELKPGFCDANGFVKPERSDPWAEPYDPKLASLRWGLAFEDAICDLVGGITDREKFCVNPDNDFITCHLDGIKDGRNQENKTAMITAYNMSWGEPGTDMIPADYQVQVQHQMICNGADVTDVNVLVFPLAPAEWEKQGYRVYENNNTILIDYAAHSKDFFVESLAKLGFFHQYHCPANPSVQAEITDRYRAFWNDNVLKETPPPVQGYDDIKWLIASPEGEIEASPEVREAWQEYTDIYFEIKSMIERQAEIKTTFVEFVQKEMENIRPGAEKRKLNIYSGNRKLFSVSRPYPGLRVSQSVVDTLSEDDPEMYEQMKNTTFADILDPVFTDKQIEKLDGLEKDVQKVLKSFKLTKLINRDSIVKNLGKTKPELLRKMQERSIVNETDPKPRLNISKPEGE